jgi:hypothetical protein
MSKFVMPEITALPDEQQKAIFQVLIKSGLLTESGEPTNLTIDNMPGHHKTFLDESLKTIGKGELTQKTVESFGIDFKCIAARVAEAAAIAACALVPGGQIVIGVCVAAAHALADQACK